MHHENSEYDDMVICHIVHLLIFEYVRYVPALGQTTSNYRKYFTSLWCVHFVVKWHLLR